MCGQISCEKSGFIVTNPDAAKNLIVSHPLLGDHELSTLKQILDHAGEWDRLKKRYKPLRSRPSRVGQALADEEKAQLFELACQDTELARKLAACVVSHVSEVESNGRFSPAQRA